MPLLNLCLLNAEGWTHPTSLNLDEVSVSSRTSFLHSYLYEFICLKCHCRLNKQLSVLNVILECGNVDIAEWHVVLGETKQRTSQK